MRKTPALVLFTTIALSVGACASPTAPDVFPDDLAPSTKSPRPTVTVDRGAPRPFLKPSATSPVSRPASPSARPSSTPSRKPVAKPQPVKPAPKPSYSKRTAKPRPVNKAKPAANVRTVSAYKVCTYKPQPCIDAGGLTYYADRILAGHDYNGYQWLASMPVGTKLKITSGPIAGTYYVYGHMRINRRGGSIPNFGEADLVAQTCVGTGSTGFSLMRRV